MNISEIRQKVETLICNKIETGMYSELPEMLMFTMAFNQKKNPKNYARSEIDAIQELVKFCKTKKSYGFHAGTMGAVHVLIKGHQITGNSELLNEATMLAHSFLEYLNTDFGFKNGVAGTLQGYLFLHSALNQDWILDDINIYTNYLVDNLRITKDGFSFFTLTDGNSKTTDDLAACFAFISVSKYLRNKAFLKVAVELCSNEARNFEWHLEFPALGLFWESWSFSFAVCNLLLYEQTRHEYFRRNFEKVYDFLKKRSSVNEDLIHSYYLLYLAKAKGLVLGDSASLILLEMKRVTLWDKYPVVYGNILLSDSFPQLDDFTSPLMPIIRGRLPASRKRVPAFKNILDIRENTLAQRILDNNSICFP